MIRKTLNVQLLVYFFLSIILTLSAVGCYYYETSSSLVIGSTSSATDEAIRKSAEYISSYTGGLKKTAGALAADETIRRYIDEDTAGNKQRANALIKTILATDPNLVSAVVITKDGRILSNESHLEMKTSGNMMEENWYKQAISNKGTPTLTSARREKLSPQRENLVISITQEISGANGQNLGVVRLDIDYRAIEEYLKTLKLGKNGYAFVIDEAENIVYHPEEEVLTSAKRQGEYREDVRMRDGYNRGQSRYLKHEKIPGSGWTIVGVASLDELDIVKKSLRNTVLVTTLLAAIVATLGSFFVVKRWGRPIRQLQGVMHTIGQGEKGVRATEAGAVEIRDLAANFNRMLDKVDDLMEDVKEKEQDIREYELKALAGQINPHFLYNTLDTIVWMAEFNDSESVVDLTKSLAKYFRLSLNQGNETIALRDEIDHVRQYLFIQKKRYGDKLNYRIEEQEQAGDLVLPKLVLQPIVENAIYHGIKGLKRPGNILIRTERQEDGTVAVCIEDDGKGFSREAVKLEERTRLGGVGIANVDKRLRLYFGEAYRMEIASEENEFTRVTFFLPTE